MVPRYSDVLGSDVVLNGVCQVNTSFIVFKDLGCCCKSRGFGGVIVLVKWGIEETVFIYF